MGATFRVQHVSVPMPPGGNDEARRFYGDTLGFTEITPPSVLGTERFVWYAVGDDGHEVHVYTMDPFVQSSPSQHFCVQVEDGPAFRQKLTAAGYPVNEEPVINNRPRFSTVDPFGNKVEITEIVGQYS
jgi:catechol 2,3-dioxygenase-like lactoylglutathione lyase family enzyme